MGSGGWPSGRILVHFRAFELKPRCRGTRAAFGLHVVLAACPVFAFGARNPLFLGLKLAVGISVALQDYNFDTFVTSFFMLMAVMLGPEGPSFVRVLQWDVLGA
jgi:hypothetical protein